MIIFVYSFRHELQWYRVLKMSEKFCFYQFFTQIMKIMSFKWKWRVNTNVIIFTPLSLSKSINQFFLNVRNFASHLESLSWFMSSLLTSELTPSRAEDQSVQSRLTTSACSIAAFSVSVTCVLSPFPRPSPFHELSSYLESSSNIPSLAIPPLLNHLPESYPS